MATIAGIAIIAGIATIARIAIIARLARIAIHESLGAETDDLQHATSDPKGSYCRCRLCPRSRAAEECRPLTNHTTNDS